MGGCLASTDGENGCVEARAAARVDAAVDHAQTGTALSRRRTASAAAAWAGARRGYRRRTLHGAAKMNG